MIKLMIRYQEKIGSGCFYHSATATFPCLFSTAYRNDKHWESARKRLGVVENA